MTYAERDELRALQDRWLARAEVRRHVERHGWGERIALPTGPTFAEVRDVLLPDWKEWFREFLGE